MASINQSTNIYQVKNERMGGFIPSWDISKNTPKQKSFDDVLSSYSPLPEKVEITPNSNDKKFGFLDIVDMVNPLQHIPIVNMAYRSITGDEIKPISKIIGGGIFGGAIGVASSIANVIIEEETGKDLIGNITSFNGMSKKELDEYKKSESKAHEYKRVEIAQGRTAGTIVVYT